MRDSKQERLAIVNPGDFAAFVVAVVGGLSVLTLVTAFARRIAGPNARGGRMGGGTPGSLIGVHMGAAAASAGIDEMREELEALRAEVAELHARFGELDDVQNRLDFTERMLAQVRERPALKESNERG